MVFLGLEKPVEYGSRLIFDPTMANMVLQALKNYVDAMKDDYLRGREDLKEFNKNFGDFFSPILKDMEWYDLNVTGATRDLINNLYAQGIDPLRSVEGRSLISRWVNNMPVGEINKRKQSAATATEYLKRRAELESEGRFNPDVEDFYGRNMDQWDTGVNGIWGYSSPMKNITMDEIIEPIISHLDYTYDENRTRQANDGNDYYTITEDRIRQTIADAMEDLTRDGTMPGYYYQRALQQTGGDVDAAKALLTDWYTNRGKDHLKEKFVPNEWKLKEYDRNTKIMLENLGHRNKLNELQYQYDHDPRYKDDGPGSKTKKEKEYYDWRTDVQNKAIANLISTPSVPYYWDKLDDAAFDYADRKGRTIQRLFGDQFKGQNASYDGIKGKYTNRFNIKLDANTVVDWIGEGIVDGRQGVSKISQKDAKNFLSEREVVENTAGYPLVHKYDGVDENLEKVGDGLGDINNIQEAIKTYGVGNTTVTPLGTAYASIRKNNGALEVYPKVRVTVTTNNGKTISAECYYKMDGGSRSTPGGAYYKDEMWVKDPVTGDNVLVDPELYKRGEYVPVTGNYRTYHDQETIAKRLKVNKKHLTDNDGVVNDGR